jgi:hypothetical protein
MARRSIWDDEGRDLDIEVTDQADWNGQVDTDASAPDVPENRPATILDQLRTAEPKIQKVRDRSWESKHPSKSYRKVPNQIRDMVNEIAAAYEYNASQIAQAFLEYALMCYQRGDFELNLELDQNGLTLMPGGWSEEQKPIWAESTWGNKSPKKKKRRKKTGAPLYKQFVGYRLSPILIEQIDEVCEARRDSDGTLIHRTYHDGEVVARFLTFSIDAYYSGKLLLEEPENA